MLAAAGGHSDYCGNEHNEIELNTEVPAWVQRKASTVAAQIHQRTPVYLDNSRSASHTYWATQYDNVNDRMLIVSTGGPFDANGVPNCDPSWPYQMGGNVLMGLDRATNLWTAPTQLAAFPFGSTSSADMCCTDPLTSDVYFVKSQQGRLWRYSPAANSWTDVGAWFLNGGYAGSAVDPVRNRLLCVGDVNGVRSPEVRSTTNAAAVSVSFGGLGAAALQMGGYPGVVYDEANDCFLVAKNGAQIEVYRIDAATYAVDLPAITGTKPAQRPNSICNSFQYVPELKGVVIANSYTGNVQFMRTHL